MERKLPPVLWIGIAALGAMALMQLLVGEQKGSDVLFLAVIGDVALLAGLLLGYKWAYMATLVLGIGGPVVVVGRNAGQTLTVTVLLVNGLVIVLVVISTRFFFPGRTGIPGDGKPEREQAWHPAAADG